ncbi:hypothetical protein [Vibrio tapetis]|uniref:Uncharacterized protein n=1 Tax=Vibrio tapetis subsp. tapetis TaxID=1671868 RepID=A0A2N8ZEP2_9VIBR|nr:hypothetical protein [Vibrio tapetis]SON50335.1 conserved membrane protein of unknown function [Vibrio tapetis subsp. tapetis]
MHLILEAIVHYALFGVLVTGAVLIAWIILAGLPLIMLTPQVVKDYRFEGKDCAEVESHLATGWDIVAIILRFSVIANVAFPWLGKKRGLSKIREFCSPWFVLSSVVFYSITCFLSVIILLSTVIMILDIYM